jgi:hypothetical protein
VEKFSSRFDALAERVKLLEQEKQEADAERSAIKAEAATDEGCAAAPPRPSPRARGKSLRLCLFRAFSLIKRGWTLLALSK